MIQVGPLRRSKDKLTGQEHGRMHTPLVAWHTQQDNAPLELITLNRLDVENHPNHFYSCCLSFAQIRCTLTRSPHHSPSRLDMPPKLDFELLLSVAEHVKEPINLIRGSNLSVVNAIKSERLAILNLAKTCKVRVRPVGVHSA